MPSQNEENLNRIWVGSMLLKTQTHLLLTFLEENPHTGNFTAEEDAAWNSHYERLNRNIYDQISLLMTLRDRL